MRRSCSLPQIAKCGLQPVSVFTRARMRIIPSAPGKEAVNLKLFQTLAAPPDCFKWNRVSDVIVIVEKREKRGRGEGKGAQKGSLIALTVGRSTPGSSLEFGPFSADCSPQDPRNTSREGGTSLCPRRIHAGEQPKTAQTPRWSPRECVAAWRSAFSPHPDTRKPRFQTSTEPGGDEA